MGKNMRESKEKHLSTLISMAALKLKEGLDEGRYPDILTLIQFGHPPCSTLWEATTKVTFLVAVYDDHQCF